MADSTTNLDLIQVGQSQKELTANALFDAGSPATLYGRREQTTLALTFGYYGGNLNGVDTPIPNGTVQLFESSSNYVEADKKTGTVLVNKTSFTTGLIPLYIITTDATSQTDWKDKRPSPLVVGSGGGADYILPTASATVKGGIKIGKNLTINPDGTLDASSGTYTLPPATQTVLGGIKVGKNLTVQSDGTLDASSGTYTLPPATQTVLGGIKVGQNLSVQPDGTLNASFTLPTASATVKGGIKVGKNLTVQADGTLDANPGAYTLPPATQSTLGGVKIGSGITVDNFGTINVDNKDVKVSLLAVMDQMGTKNLTFNGNPNEYPTINPNTLKYFTGIVTAKDNGNTGIVAVFKIGAVMSNSNNNTSFVVDPTVELIAMSKEAENVSIFLQVTSYGLSSNELIIACTHYHSATITFNAILEVYENNN